MVTNRIPKIALLWLLPVLTASVAHAKQVPAISGHAYSAGDNSCFFPQFSWNGVRNGCTGTRPFVIPLDNHLTSTGPVTIKGWPQTCSGCVAVSPMCTAYRVSASGSKLGEATAPVNSAGKTIAAFATVAPTDTLHLVCQMAGTDTPGAMGLYSIQW